MIGTITNFDYETNTYITQDCYKEILKLDKLLTEANIPHTCDKFCDGYQVIYYYNGERIADAIEHFGSYGHEDDSLEIMGLLTPEEGEHESVLGGLTAYDVFGRIAHHYFTHINKENE